MPFDPLHPFSHRPAPSNCPHFVIAVSSIFPLKKNPNYVSLVPFVKCLSKFDRCGGSSVVQNAQGGGQHQHGTIPCLRLLRQEEAGERRELGSGALTPSLLYLRDLLTLLASGDTSVLPLLSSHFPA